AGKLKIESIELNIEELVDSVISLMTKSAERRGIKLKRKIAKNVPTWVRGDPFRLRQILTNLVGNAIKFTEKGTVSVEVSRHASSPKEVVILFAVRDTGIGMSQDEVASLFELFSQADASTTRKYGGTGLGLVICKRLVEMMAGRIGVKSEESRGSVFWFVVPMRKGLHEAPSSRKNLQGVRALLAGFDELENQRIISYLSEWDMLHESAATAMETLTKLKASAKLGTSWSYDVLIC
ncbi:MAG: sensor histidine kinase, partial [Gammaproteobacteria bacterium]|nr:sensor histidine kinase [Gammaproteobacteria bacterium]